ncbi:Inositol polyphosphate multikinase alpha [Sesamum angolense]|uniref:Inositol polyphosphate multikinase n=1 Tax=Sesamum angolense TaxID=2727404 RepID=A0AAE1WFZ9_9LAMI|nr:Inositol polyphosphate multikinase alpha [Sesamum angolense]
MLKVPGHQAVGLKTDGGKLRPRVDDSRRFYKPLQGDEQSGFWKPKKTWIQSISTYEVRILLKKFVSSYTLALKPDCVFESILYGGSKGILSQLLELKAWFEDQTSYHFFACSIIMTFEKELALEGKNPCPDIKLVDFTHVFEGRGIIDHNFLCGLCFLIKFISKILTTPEDSAINGLVYSIAKAYEHFGEPNFSARRAMFQSPTPSNTSVSGDRANSSRQSVKHEVVYVDDDDDSNEVVEVSSGSEEL